MIVTFFISTAKLSPCSVGVGFWLKNPFLLIALFQHGILNLNYVEMFVFCP